MRSDPHKIESLRTQLSGALILPGDAQFNASRQIWNLCFDRRPGIIVRCTSAADVVAAVRFAREHNLEIAIKGGGHHAAGHASTDGGVLLDLSGLRAIEVDPERRYAVAQAGLTWAHFDQVTQAFGLACTGPIVSMTGIAGFTLGGGFGWLHRKIGLGCDNLKSATVVAADGDLVTASDANNHDLLWGLCGSGWNFGVITSMGFQLHPIGPSVVAGLIYFPLARFPELVDHHRKRISQFPDELTTWFFLRLAPARADNTEGVGWAPGRGPGLLPLRRLRRCDELEVRIDELRQADCGYGRYDRILTMAAVIERALGQRFFQ
jgi:FAD/FMN-containing dehydrogenase